MRSQGFSLVELVVVISILAILSTVSFLSFSQYMVDARNSDRVSDLGSMKISLRTSKQRNGAYPAPGGKIPLTLAATTIGYQWWFNTSLGISTLSEIPMDPRVTTQYYAYGTTSNRQLFQLWTIIETDPKIMAKVDGDYKTVARDIFPSLLTASTGASLDIGSATINKTFILNNGTFNLPYDLSGAPKATGISLAAIIAEAGTSILESSDYLDCRSIYDAGRSIGATTYRVSDGNGWLTNTGCTMNPPTY